MIFHVRGMALGAYRRDVDPSCSNDDDAEAAILEALRNAHQINEVRRDGKVRYRAPQRSGAPWSRCYLIVNPATGDVIGAMPSRSTPRGPGAPTRADRASDVTIRLRVTGDEQNRIEALAEERGLTMSEWLRQRGTTTGPARPPR